MAQGGQTGPMIVLIAVPLGALILAAVISVRRGRKRTTGGRSQWNQRRPAFRGPGQSKKSDRANSIAALGYFVEHKRTYEVIFGIGTEPDQSRGLAYAGTMEFDDDSVIVCGRLDFRPADGITVGGFFHIWWLTIVGAAIGAVAWVLLKVGTKPRRHVARVSGAAAFRGLNSTTFALEMGRRRWLLVSPSRREDPVSFSRAIHQVYGPEIEAIPMDRMSAAMARMLVVLVALAVIAGVALVVACALYPLG